jgi:hypothetical protein
MMCHKSSTKIILSLILINLIFGMCIASCSKKETKYHYAEIYLDCENYSNAQNDPGNCQVLSDTTSGLRVQEGMIVSEDYVKEIMDELGWIKISHTQKYKDVDGVAYRIDVYKYKRETE